MYYSQILSLQINGCVDLYKTREVKMVQIILFNLMEFIIQPNFVVNKMKVPHEE